MRANAPLFQGGAKAVKGGSNSTGKKVPQTINVVKHYPYFEFSPLKNQAGKSMWLPAYGMVTAPTDMDAPGDQSNSWTELWEKGGMQHFGQKRDELLKAVVALARMVCKNLRISWWSVRNSEISKCLYFQP